MHSRTHTKTHTHACTYTLAYAHVRTSRPCGTTAPLAVAGALQVRALPPQAPGTAARGGGSPASRACLIGRLGHCHQKLGRLQGPGLLMRAPPAPPCYQAQPQLHALLQALLASPCRRPRTAALLAPTHQRPPWKRAPFHHLHIAPLHHCQSPPRHHQHSAPLLHWLAARPAPPPCCTRAPTRAGGARQRREAHPGPAPRWASKQALSGLRPPAAGLAPPRSKTPAMRCGMGAERGIWHHIQRVRWARLPPVAAALVAGAALATVPWLSGRSGYLC